MSVRLTILLAALVPSNVQAQLNTRPVASDQRVPSPSQASDPSATLLERGEGRMVANAAAAEITKRFVFADQGRSYAAMLRANAAAGRYDRGTRGELADRMTEDLLAVHKDGHLHVSVAQHDERGSSAGGTAHKMPPLIQSAKWIAPGIAYIRPSAFLGDKSEVAAFSRFMREHSTAKTLIFDLRNHHGGGLSEMNVIFAYLFSSKTPLVGMEMRRSTFDEGGAPFESSPELKRVDTRSNVRFIHYAVPGPATPLRRAKVYLLVSNATASAAEHFALAMKASHRGILIGEATAGANHFGGPVPVSDHFTVWMPVGRTYDLKTGKDWEGSGVTPDVTVDPRLALVTALDKAGVPNLEAVRLAALEVPAEPVHRDKLRAR